MNKSSLPQGEDGKWVLKSFYMKKGYEFSDMNNSNDYLTINVSNGIEDKELRMGGKFSRHFPLLLKVADSLLDEPIIWHTWNAANAPGKWADSVWFYRIELNGD
jgi:hypothetical protein